MNMMTAFITAPDARRQRLLELFRAFDRNDIELAVDLLIEQLDAADDDPDLEPDGDEADGSCTTDDPVPTDALRHGVDWDVGDPDDAEDDDPREYDLRFPAIDALDFELRPVAESRARAAGGSV